MINVIMQSIKIDVDDKLQQRTQSTPWTYYSGGYDHVLGDRPHSKVSGYLEKEKYEKRNIE